MHREATAALVRREEYTPPAFWIRSADLTFDLEPGKTIVGSKLRVERNAAVPAGQALRLHGEALTLLRVLADGTSVSFRHEGDELVIDNPPAAEAFTLEIRNTCNPEANTQLNGLYTSGGGFFTQCEAQGFRRITFFLDRPDVMAVYTVTLRADKARYPVLLSNGNLVEQGALDNGRHFAKWHDPHPKPSYLFALVAGKLVAREQRIRSRSGRDHLLQIYVRPGDLERTEHAMRALIASVAWDEARFGLPLDLDRFMVVAVSDFNGGAMENKGLNIFNTQLLLASAASATDEDFHRVESVVAHEYFHTGTGNRITCRDWFQLSLKEGLTVFRDQEFSADMAATPSGRALQRIRDVQRLRTRQFPEDAGPMAHPVRPDAYQAIDNFYTPTVYEKGAEVVRMMQALVGGRDGFRRGMDLYVKRHDGQAVTCDDFAQAMADANPGSALSSRLDAFKRWYAQAGTPQVRASGVYDSAAQRYTLTLRQHTAPTPGQPDKLPLVIPVLSALIGSEGQALAAERLLVLEQVEQTFVFDGITAEPVHSLLRGYSAPVHLDDGLSEAHKRTLLAHDSDAFNRYEAGQRLVMDMLLRAITQGTAPQPTWSLQEALRRLLRDEALDAGFKAAALTPVDEMTLADQLPGDVDPHRIHSVCEQWRQWLAEHLHEDWLWAWQAHAVRGGFEPSVVQAGQRALCSLALGMLCLHGVAQGDTAWPGRAYQRVKDASNMSERYAAAQALLEAQSPLAAQALAHFHRAAVGDELMMDKWFMLQALAPEAVPAAEGAASSFARAKALLQHPDFSMKNPNRVRSLLFWLAMANPASFHRGDAAGYVMWAERLIELDATNPKLAGRYARLMERWARLAEPYRSAAREAVARVAAKADLSADVREVLELALKP